ncbi:RHS repeat domain-containing protein [Acinetobacter sp. PVC-6A]|uniref:RHS repeat domain-containing protein n=1 Tax=Acinetobacter TaxID=469 RepID=UPI00295792AF|nr:RHS repeat-associated core domain-containing protein [Acinetobacter baumannii]
MKQSLTVLKFVIVSIISLLSVLQLSYAAEEITYYHNDISGSPLLATNASGNVLWKESYRPYGDKLTKSAASQNNKIGFHGKPFDDDTGLSYMQARYYDPILGRFTGMDPVDYQEDNLHSFNRYAYANNNPYKYVDPDGNMALFSRLILPVLKETAKTTTKETTKDIAKSQIKNEVNQKLINQSASAVKNKVDIKSAYKRPSGATTKKQRESVQGKPCVDCGTNTSRQVADHKKPLVKEYYETGTIDKTRMRDLNAVQPQCPTCSAKQGAEMSRYSRQMKKEYGFD